MHSNSGGRFKKELFQLEFEKQLPELQQKTRIVTETNIYTFELEFHLMINRLFRYNNSTLSEPLFADIVRLQAFQDLRSEIHMQMEKNIQARLDAGNWRPTDFELKLDAFKEEIEPQVWNAVKVMNKKGYETISSGFAGEYGERQQIDGAFSVDITTIEKLEIIGVSVMPYPDPFMYGEMIIFYPDKPDLAKITAIWNRIARTLPDLTKPRRKKS